MTDQHDSEDIVITNQESLQAIVRTITLFQGRFVLVLLRCNYAALRNSTVKTIHELSPVTISEITLPVSVKTLYTAINEQIGEKRPAALMVFGLESVQDLEAVLISANQVREEFRKQFSFPIMLWVNDQVFKKIVRLATDLENWSTTIEFIAANNCLEYEYYELIYTQCQQANLAISSFFLELSAEKFLQDLSIPLGNRLQIDTACQYLEKINQRPDAEIIAKLNLILGRDDYTSDRINTALDKFQQCLDYWRLSNDWEWQIFILLHIAACYGKSNIQNFENFLAQTSDIFNQFPNFTIFRQSIYSSNNQLELANLSLIKISEILEILNCWEGLEIFASKSLEFHQLYNSTHVIIAYDYGFMAEAAIQKSQWSKASQYAYSALLQFNKVKEYKQLNCPLFPLVLEQIYRLLLVKVQINLGDIEAGKQELNLAISNLKTSLDNNYNSGIDNLIRLLRKLRKLYFEQEQYLEAFNVKQKQYSIEQQYGLRAFVGAGRLHAQKKSNKLDAVAQEILASSRKADLEKLLEKVSSTQHKLTIIYGSPGVGKSSLLGAGLVPVLKQRPIEARAVLPILVQVYTPWIEQLIIAYKKAYIEEVSNELHIYPKVEEIIISLQKHVEDNFFIVLIFDQFEEFFTNQSPETRWIFYNFLQTCLNIPFVKIVLSLREDYLHNLLEIERQPDFKSIIPNILDDKIRYYLGNFSTQDTKIFIEQITTNSKRNLEPALVTTIVENLSNQSGEVSPIELQIVGTQLQNKQITTIKKYLAHGPKERLIEGYIKEIIDDCGYQNETAVLLTLYFLTDEHRQRPLKTRAELITELAELENVEKLELILEILVRSGLVMVFPGKPERYQLIHDYLTNIIRTLQQTQQSLQEQLKQLRAHVINNELEISRLQSALSHNKPQKQTQLQHQTASTDLLTELKELRKRDELSRLERERLLSKIEQQELQAELLENEKLRTTQVKTNRLLKNALLASALGIFILIGSIWTAFYQGNKAVISASIAAAASSEALFSLGKDIDALREGLRAGKRIETAFLPDAQTQQLVRTALYQATYGMRVREINRLEGHLADVNSVVFSPSGSLIASASRDGTVRLWQANGKKLHILKGHTKRVNTIAFSADGTMLASGSSDKTVKLWSIDGKLLRTFAHNTAVNGVAFSPDGKTIASGGADNIVRLWNKEGKVLASMRGHTLPVTSLAIAPDGSMIASASSDRTIKLWSRDGKQLQTLKGHDDTVSAVAWAPNSNMLASTGWDRTVKLWSRDGKLLHSIPAHKQVIMSVAFSPDGKTLASASWDKTVKLWNIDVASEKPIEQPIETLKGHNDWVTSVNFSSDGQTLASASRDTNIKLWRWKYLPLKSIQAHSKDVTMLSYSHQGDIFASSSKDGSVKIWSLDGKLQHTLPGHKDAWDISFNSDGQTIASASSDNTVKLWSRNGKLLKTLEGHLDSVLSVDWAPSGNMLVSAGSDKTIRLWSQDGKLIAKLIGHRDAVNWIRFRPDGKYIASASDDNTVKIWSTDGKLIRTITAHNRPVYAVVWSKDNILATASLDSTVKLWNNNWNLIQTLNGDGEGFTTVSFSPDGQTIATMSEGKIKLWTHKGYLELVLNAQDDIFTSLSFTPDSKTLVTGNSKGKIVFRNLADTKTKKLMEKGCELLRDYLQNNAKVPESDRNLCP
ncbi:WD-40 repeat-containing protein [Calothrix sp. NIES-4071]|nr:WD-40 repeat-containing protein [Calothrix sp. NIES-4071]BAZ56768.1 WD-40 repeat-containing protein [Calothrix sp. NIES-4105]